MGSLLPLVKALATEVVRLPGCSAAVVETLLHGKSKHVWHRTHRLAMAVAQAQQWQEEPSMAQLETRPFVCMAEMDTLVVSPLPSEADELRSEAKDKKARVLRLVLAPTAPPPSSRPQHPDWS